MDKTITFILLFIVLSGVAYYLWQEHETNLVLENAKPPPTVEPSTILPEVIEEEVHYPVVEQVLSTNNEKTDPPGQVIAEVLQLPSLNESDEVMQTVFSRIYAPLRLAEIFIFTEFARHFVVTVDNMTAKKLPQRLAFTHPPAGDLMVKKTASEKEFLLDEINFGRYSRYMDFIDNVNDQELVSIYIRYYPLFQEAYEELGYPGRYFNDRLITVIDHLLQTPDVDESIKLVQPKVFYQFTNPELEKLSVGQKILLRVGHKNALRIKSRLVNLRHLLTTLGM
jgi:hypothetical protein